jgi:hypothetical protein
MRSFLTSWYNTFVKSSSRPFTGKAALRKSARGCTGIVSPAGLGQESARSDRSFSTSV